MPTSAKAWIMHVRGQKTHPVGTLGELIPHETLETKRVDSLALGTSKVVGNRRTLGAITCPVCQLWATTRGISTVTTSILHCLG